MRPIWLASSLPAGYAGAASLSVFVLPASLVASLSLLASPPAARADQFFATQVIGATPGQFQTTNPNYNDPARTLGGPRGGDGVNAGLDIYNLGVGGTLTLGFAAAGGTVPRAIQNGPGVDFIVSENPLENTFGGTDDVFGELLFVEVSSNGQDFARFPVVSDMPGPVGPYDVIDPDLVSGFSGVRPVMANVDTPGSPDPFDPAAAGGDAFDLAALAAHPLVTSGVLDLQDVRFVRLVDVVGDGSLADANGNPIYDPFDYDGGFPDNNGADVDAVTVINGAVVPEPAALPLLGAALAGVFMVRRPRRG